MQTSNLYMRVLVLETFLVKFLPAPEPFRRKRCFRVGLGIFISTLSAGSSLDPARGGDLLETEAARSQNSNLWLPRELLSVGFNFQI